MSRTVSPSSGKPYGLALVCRTWRAPRATVYRCRLPSRPEPAGRPGPVGPMSDTALLAAIRAVLAGSPFHGEGHRKIWAELVKVPPAQRVEYQRRDDCALLACGPQNAGCCGSRERTICSPHRASDHRAARAAMTALSFPKPWT